MNARTYVLIDAVAGKAPEVIRALRGRPGITLADCVEGPPDIVMMAEAEDNQALADLTIRALTSIDNLTNGIQLLPVCGEELNIQRRRVGSRKDG